MTSRTGPASGPARPPKLLERVRGVARLRHLSRRTEDAYVQWIRRFVLFHGKRHPQEMVPAEVVAFLSDLAVRGAVSPSAQSQALSALLFLYREILGRELGNLDSAARPRRKRPIPVVMSRDEVRRVLAGLGGHHQLAAILLYGAGLRLLECLRLRIQDVDLERRQLRVREGKGSRDRRCPLPMRERERIERHLRKRRKRAGRGRSTLDRTGSPRVAAAAARRTTASPATPEAPALGCPSAQPFLSPAARNNPSPGR